MGSLVPTSSGDSLLPCAHGEQPQGERQGWDPHFLEAAQLKCLGAPLWPGRRGADPSRGWRRCSARAGFAVPMGKRASD